MSRNTFNAVPYQVTTDRRPGLDVIFRQVRQEHPGWPAFLCLGEAKARWTKRNACPSSAVSPAKA